MVFKRTVVRSNLHRAICHSFILFIVAAFGRIDSLPTHPQLHDLFSEFLPKRDPSGAFFSLRCLIYKVHAVSGGTLLLQQTSFRLSRTFFRSFRPAIRFAQQQLRQNNISFAVCQLLFSRFFNFFFSSSAGALTSATALLEYQMLRQLSTPNFTVCVTFYVFQFFPLISRFCCILSLIILIPIINYTYY